MPICLPKIGSTVRTSNGEEYEVKGIIGTEPIIAYDFVRIGFRISMHATVVTKDGNIEQRRMQR